MGRDGGAGDGPRAASDRLLSVVVADDSVVVRRATVELIETDANFSVVAEAGDAPDAILAATAHQPDLAVLDVQMPGGGGPEAALRIREIAPTTRVVAYSAFADMSSKTAMEAAGAVAYVVQGRAALRRAGAR
jgi:DNA-binding NarL/FixJ family response regulator